MAIRRPNKPAEEFEPEELFAVGDRRSVPASEPQVYSGFPVDFALRKKVTVSQDNQAYSRLMGSKRLSTNTDSQESGVGGMRWDYMDGYWEGDGGSADPDEYSYMWRRAHGYFDVVIPNSTSYKPAPNTHHHNLGVAPELIIAKCRDYDQEWYVGIQGDLTGDQYYQMALNTDAQGSLAGTTFSWSKHTDKTFHSTLFGTSAGYIHYLFASVPGISKVGSYTGTGLSGDGSFLDIDCGFTNGARWLLAKRTDGVGDWWMTTGSIPNAPLGMVIRLNDSTPEVFGGFFSPIPSGFRVAESNMNTAGQEYIYYAIA
jgi:hypothetical protein